MNDNIIPYVPIADRVQATNETSQFLCQQFFTMIDKIVESQFIFNHDTSKGFLSINPEHINDLLKELKQGEVDIHILQNHLENLIYPKYLGAKQVNSSIWNNNDVHVWQFRLDQIDQKDEVSISADDAELNMDQALAYIKIWRQSLETNTHNPQTTYQANDLVYALLDIELKLSKVQRFLNNY
ncbi:hypothetical protein QSV37_17415 [Acinetobacter sp. VNK23]|uniref:hypothetical protein n=1 Tax=Acinetobacter thutiue TaxID=2998078 RepID=UPI0025759E21|nr:hypothetical protein [Acinetobacter thutiue]MDM1022053.1 hypothetical protein [Acinetobacter thutiue]